jgi:hypothetical protein
LVSLGIALAIVALVFGSGCHLNSQKAKEMMKVNYVPIGVETLTPVTSANIEARGRYCEIRSDREIFAIKKVLNSAVRSSSQEFTDLVLRVKLIEVFDTGNTLLTLVENDGRVRFANGEGGLISSRNMDTLKKVIETQCGNPER